MPGTFIGQTLTPNEISSARIPSQAPLTRVLDELSQWVKVDEPTRTERGNWRDLSETELL